MENPDLTLPAGIYDAVKKLASHCEKTKCADCCLKLDEYLGCLLQQVPEDFLDFRIERKSKHG